MSTIYLDVYFCILFDCLMHIFRRHTEPTSWGPYQKRSKSSHKKTCEAQSLETKSNKIACLCVPENMKNVRIPHAAFCFLTKYFVVFCNATYGRVLLSFST
jgi:hypothetical protein